MAKTSDAITRFAQQLGMSERRIGEIAKALRAADEDLWPVGGVGGGKRAAHVHAHHLRNLLIASMAAEHVPAAAGIAKTYAALTARMVPLSSRKTIPPYLKCLPFPFYSHSLTFGEAIDLLIKAYADPKRREDLVALGINFEVYRSVPSARIIAKVLPNEEIRSKDNPVPREQERWLAAFANIRSDFASRVRVRQPLMVKAELWAEDICTACAEMIADTLRSERG